MGIFDLFSKRKAAQQGKVPELQTQALPEKFRRQVVHLFLDTIGLWVKLPAHMPPDLVPRPSNQAWANIFKVVCREHGLFALGDPDESLADQCIQYLLTAETDAALDLMEYALLYIDREIRRYDRYQYKQLTGVTPEPDRAIEEFNVRCRENGVGYAYERGQIITVSSTFVHTQVVEPALTLLHDEGFRGAQDEFLRAHASLRRGDYKGAILEAGKAFESAMKTICDRKKWPYDANATAKPLIAVLINNGLIPASLQTQFAHFRELLESGVPTLRNKTGGHGQGPEPVTVPRELAEYALHLAAANIVFLVKLSKAS